MKYAKVAVVVAGSVMAVGSGAPAFAAAGAGRVPSSVNGGVNQVLAQQPLQKAADGLRADGGAKGALPSLLGGVPAPSLFVAGVPIRG